MYLITCQRVCFLSLKEDTRFAPLSQADALVKFALRRNHLANVPAMKTIAGPYSPQCCGLRGNITFYDQNALRQMGISVHGSEEAMQEQSSAISEKQREAYQVQYRDWLSGNRKTRPHSSVRWGGSDLRLYPESETAKRFAAVVHAPFLDFRNGVPPRVRQGFHCIACKGNEEGPRERNCRRGFIEETFQHHIEECGEIVNGIHVQ